MPWSSIEQQFTMNDPILNRHSRDLFKIDLDQNTKVEHKGKPEVDTTGSDENPVPNPQTHQKPSPPSDNKKSPSISQIQNVFVQKPSNESSKDGINPKPQEDQKQPPTNLYKWPSEYDRIKSGTSKNVDLDKKQESQNTGETLEQKGSNKSKDKKRYQEKKPKYREKESEREPQQEIVEDKKRSGVEKVEKVENVEKAKQTEKAEKADIVSQGAKQSPFEQTIQLYYWPIKGLVERIRLLLQYLNIKYQNKHLTSQQEWQSLKQKSTIPIFSLPFIKDGQQTVVETEAIMIYLILKAGREELLGRNNQQKVNIAQIRGHFGTLHSEYVMMVYGDFQEKKKGFVESARCYLQSFSEFMGDNEYICKEITYVDFLLAEFFDILNKLDPSLMSGFPKLNQLRERIYNEPKIREYIQSEDFLNTPLNSEHAHWNGDISEESKHQSSDNCKEEEPSKNSKEVQKQPPLE